jgi:beta-lactam-binding protein with PASTA domain
MVYKGSKITPGTRVPKGSTIDLIVTDGGGTEITVSDYRNMSLEDAKVSILGNNLAVGRVNLFGDTTNGVIIQQIPEPGETAKVGDAVELWIGQPGATIEDQQTDDPENDPDQ